ncbi:glycosyltransferase family 2 protein [Cohaesibacter sp. CAU 1516]|uniref:glycosyltransferase family 2 protein n=1 Tax=Cohaesibacter sp. CAU 1516 TaxID=2576038 RepID=UPI0010FEFBC5|nr:glycosyltransferase family 2 protein [Cohaesibacter sp. CAU 1516]TLP48159.1 glycosyltransferase family 2 protein [Cohaesibacter sp. CAU 1516]
MFRFLRPRPLVSICIPAYDAQPFIARVLESALSQSVDDIEIIVSNDGALPTPDLQSYRKHPKIRVINQRKRLGWVANTNTVLSKARGQYFMVLPHDDLLAPTYLEACLSCLESEPDTFAAYSDIEYHGGILEASELLGTLDERISHMMENLYNGYSFRALMRRRPADWPALAMRHNPPTDCCVDTTWILQQTLLGALRRVRQPLYFKTLHETNTHASWERIPPDMLVSGWWQHCETLGMLARERTNNHTLIDRLVAHRRDPRRVIETPLFLRNAFDALYPQDLHLLNEKGEQEQSRSPSPLS